MKAMTRVSGIVAGLLLTLIVSGCAGGGEAPTATATSTATATETPPPTAPPPTATPTATPTTNPLAQACVDADGSLDTALCCATAGAFPDLCSVGACGCPPGSSVDTAVCDCGEGRCFDGTTCVTFAENACTVSGGTVTSTACCVEAGAFPDTCAVGACGCSPESSVDTAVCDCGEGRCFDGTVCIDQRQRACRDSGGTPVTAPCCTSAGSFPDTCAIGVCGCAPENSTDTMLCQCPDGECFDGTGCVAGGG